MDWAGETRAEVQYPEVLRCGAGWDGVVLVLVLSFFCDRLEDDIRHTSSQLPTTSPTCSPRDNISSQVPAQRPAFSRSRAASLRPHQADPPPRLSHATLSRRFEKGSSSTLDGSGCAALLHSLIYLKLVPPREAHCLRTRESNCQQSTNHSIPLPLPLPLSRKKLRKRQPPPPRPNPGLGLSAPPSPCTIPGGQLTLHIRIQYQNTRPCSLLVKAFLPSLSADGGEGKPTECLPPPSKKATKRLTRHSIAAIC
jgi:hypothetical protein